MTTAIRRAALDGTGRAALKAILAAHPDAQVVDGPAIVPDQIAAAEPPLLVPADLLEEVPLRAIAVAEPVVGFAAFLDGIQRARIPAWLRGIPYVLGTVAAAIRERVDRRLATWTGRPPAVEHRFYLPLLYTDQFPADSHGFAVVDTTAAADGGRMPSRHPAALLERALQCIQADRERLERSLAGAWVASSRGALCADGPLPVPLPAGGPGDVVGIVKTHRTLYAEGPALDLVLALRAGERSPAFVVSAGRRQPVATWYVRVRERRGREALWGLVRVECSVTERISERADLVSRWVLAEKSPLALPDPRWDRMTYGVRDCEAFLRAIS